MKLQESLESEQGAGSQQGPSTPPLLVRDLMTQVVHFCLPGESMNQAARAMWEHDVGCLPIVDKDGHVVGMLTDRDICMAAYTQGAALPRLPITVGMSARVVACSPAATVAAALQLMQTCQLRRLPVVDPEGRLAGILSLTDIAHAAARANGSQQPGFRDLTQTLVAITQPRVELPGPAEERA